MSVTAGSSSRSSSPAPRCPPPRPGSPRRRRRRSRRRSAPCPSPGSARSECLKPRIAVAARIGLTPARSLGGEHRALVRVRHVDGADAAHAPPGCARTPPRAVPGMRKSATYWPRPVRKRSSSLRGTDAPMPQSDMCVLALPSAVCPKHGLANPPASGPACRTIDRKTRCLPKTPGSLARAGRRSRHPSARRGDEHGNALCGGSRGVGPE